MSALDPPCHDGKFVFLSKPRILRDLDESLIVEVDIVQTTIVFRRRDNAIAYQGAFVDVTHDDRVHRVKYVHDVDAELVTQAQDRALDACAAYDGEPQTERKPERVTS